VLSILKMLTEVDYVLKLEANHFGFYDADNILGRSFRSCSQKYLAFSVFNASKPFINHIIHSARLYLVCQKYANGDTRFPLTTLVFERGFERSLEFSEYLAHST